MKKGPAYDDCMVWLTFMVGVPFNLFFSIALIGLCFDLVNHFTVSHMIVWVGGVIFAIILWVAILEKADVIIIEKESKE